MYTLQSLLTEMLDEGFQFRIRLSKAGTVQVEFQQDVERNQDGMRKVLGAVHHFTAMQLDSSSSNLEQMIVHELHTKWAHCRDLRNRFLSGEVLDD